VARSDLRQSQLELLRAIGLRLDTAVRLTGKMEYAPLEPITAAKALEAALASRADWKAQQTREQAARLTFSSVKFERLPSVAGFADYGTTGNGINGPMASRCAYRSSTAGAAMPGAPRAARSTSRSASGPPTCASRSSLKCSLPWTTCSPPKSR
jgi:outer membrane protein TolC